VGQKYFLSLLCRRALILLPLDDIAPALGDAK